MEEWDWSTKLEDGYGKETGDGRQICFSGSRGGKHRGCYLVVIETPDS